MPTYDYQCEACGKVVEVFHAMSESGPEFCDCPQKGRMRRLLSPGSGLIFRGSGFYITDYARKDGGNGSSGSNDGSRKSGSSSASTESSPSSTEASKPTASDSSPSPTSDSKDTT
jgi:putative FmdB family regulatory protein